MQDSTDVGVFVALSAFIGDSTGVFLHTMRRLTEDTNILWVCLGGRGVLWLESWRLHIFQELNFDKVDSVVRFQWSRVATG